MLNRFALNTAQLNAGIAQVVGGYTDAFNKPFKLELHEQTGALVYTLPRWYGGQWERTAGKSNWLQFSYPGDDVRMSALSRTREVWLFEGDNTTPSDKFVISRSQTIEGETLTEVVNCRSLLHRLAREDGIEYEQTTDTPISTVINALLELQRETAGEIGFGTIDSNFGAAVWKGKFSNTTILAALNNIVDMVGGWMEVDIDRRLNLLNQMGVVQNHIIRIGRNVTQIQQFRDFDQQANRIIAYGWKNSRGQQRTVTVNDATAQAADGIIPGTLTDLTIGNTPALTLAANRELARRSAGLQSVDIGMIDLSRSDVNYSFEADVLQIGSVVTLVGGASGMDRQVKITKIRRSLDNPLDVKIHVTDPDSDDPRETQQPRDFRQRWTLAQKRAFHGQQDAYSPNPDEDDSATEGLVPFRRAANVGSLPNTDIEPYALGFVDDTGILYMRNTANDDWLPVNRWEDGP